MYRFPLPGRGLKTALASLRQIFTLIQSNVSSMYLTIKR